MEAILNLFDIQESEERKEKFHTAVAKLLYASKRVRPDIVSAVTFLCTRLKVQNEADWRKLERLIKYLRGSRSLSLTIAMRKSIELRAFVDASYGVHPDMKSYTGVSITLGQGIIHNIREECKAEAQCELIGVSDSLNTILRMRNFLVEQGYEMAPINLK